MPIFSRFGADFFTVYADFSRFIRDINGEKKKLVIDDRFLTVSFSRFAPSRNRPYAHVVRLGVSRRNSGKTPEMLSELFLEFPSRVWQGTLKPYTIEAEIIT